MSNGTKSGYTKTGKKVKSIDDGRVDLTYNWVYDVFIDNKGDEFIIDDIGDKRYWSIYDDDYYELVDDMVTITGNVTTTNETKPKFKVGDKVKVVNIDYISEFAGVIKVGHIGDIIHIDENDCLNPYQVRFDGFDVRNSWWFTDKCIELVSDDTKPSENESSPIKSDGMVDKANETKTKFKVGDKVMVVNTDYISAYDAGVRVGDIGTVIESGVDKYHVKFEGTSYDCDWFFTDKCIELVDGTVDTTNDIRDTDETKPKFKVGDKVKVVDIGYISQATSDIKVGDVGVITCVDSDYVVNPYRVEFDDDYWWFTDKCIELVNDDTDTIENNPTESAPIVSDGGSSSYYAQQIPKGMLERFNTTGTIEAKDVIRLFLGNDFNMGNIFKAYCRIISLRNGKGKAGIDEQYDLTKVKYFAEDELNYYLENKDV